MAASSSCSASRAGTAGPAPQGQALGLSASAPALHPEGQLRMPVKRQNLRKRAKEIVALSSLCTASSTGMLQHDHLRRINHVLENVDEQQCELATDSGSRAPPRDKEWVRPLLQVEKAAARQSGAVQQEGKWKLKRGHWSFHEPEPLIPPGVSASEALDRLVAAEEARGRGPQYRNGVLGPPGQQRRWRVRKPDGGFFDAECV